MPMSDRDDFPALARARQLWDSGATDAALRAFDRAVAERPQNVRAHLEAARAFGGRFEIARAESLLERATDLDGQDPAVATQIAVTYGRIYREHRAIALLEAMPARTAGARAELAALYERAGRLDDALAEIDACRAIAPGAAEPSLARARLLRRQGEREAAHALLPDLTQEGLPPALRAEAWTELCYIHDLEGETDRAAAAIAEAHAVLRALPQTPDLLKRARANNRLVAKLARAFRAGTLARWREMSPQEGLPTAHLTGFPRSGTTLLEQCLDAHPGLIASPERPTFTRDTLPALCRAGGGPLEIATLDRVARDAARRERTRYLDFMGAALGEPIGDRVHLDKNPNHTGLIPGLLRLDPHARIVFALRDPRDVVTSCVLRTFRLTEFSAMLLDWGTACELYATEMGAWLRYRERIPHGQWVEVRYESMVADPMAQVRRVLPTLGLDWDDGVTRYRDGLKGKIVNSPTQTEVRQPIHDRAIGRWRAYRRHLGPHLHILAPFIEAFGYQS